MFFHRTILAETVCNAWFGTVLLFSAPHSTECQKGPSLALTVKVRQCFKYFQEKKLLNELIKIWVDDGVYRTAPVTTTVLFKIYRHAFSSAILILNYSLMHLYFLLYSVFLNRVTPKTNKTNSSCFISAGRSIKLLLFVCIMHWTAEKCNTRCWLLCTEFITLHCIPLNYNILITLIPYSNDLIN